MFQRGGIRLTAQISESDIKPGIRELFDDRSPDAFCPSGDQCDFGAHGFLLYFLDFLFDTAAVRTACFPPHSILGRV
jgi:hypothetical protein